MTVDKDCIVAAAVGLWNEVGYAESSLRQLAQLPCWESSIRKVRSATAVPRAIKKTTMRCRRDTEPPQERIGVACSHRCGGETLMQGSGGHWPIFSMCSLPYWRSC